MRVPGRAGCAGTPSTRVPSELLLGVGFLAIVAATVVAAIAFGPHRAAERLALLAVAVGGFAVVTGDMIAAMATAAVGWLFLNGFLVDQHAELRWHGTADLVRLAVLSGAALAGTAYAWLHQTAGRYVRADLRDSGLVWPKDGPPTDELPGSHLMREVPGLGTCVGVADEHGGEPAAHNGRALRGGLASPSRPGEPEESDG